MHYQLGHVITTWQAVVAQLRRKSVCWKGNPLSEEDTATFADAIAMCCIHLIDLRKRFGGIGPDREIIAWAHFVCTLDVSLFGSFLSDVITVLRHVSEPMTLGRFKRLLGGEYPTGQLISPIRGSLEAFLEDPSAERLYPCYQFFAFLSHLSLQDLEIDLEGEYEELEQYLRQLRYPKAYITEMNAIMREWMKDFSVNEENFAPKHGPGGTAETPRYFVATQKYAFLGTDELIDYVFGKFAGLDVASYYAYPPVKVSDSSYGDPLFRWSRTSHLVFVPKSMKTRRCISKEPTTLQFLQQGVNACIDGYIHNHPYLRQRIDLHDQSRNASLALRSSQDKRFATIDLSSASDTVTLQLVKSVFRGTPLYPYLVALRSRTVRLPSGKDLVVEKYAPMGSALCFPVETLIFSCAVELAVRRAHREGLGLHPAYRVYGDDIIVSEPLYEDVLRILGSLGFLANESKSFGHNDRFRESCGMEAYDGQDITPMRISRGFKTFRDRWESGHASQYMGLIDMANQCHEYDFRLLRAWIIRFLLDDTAAPPLFSEDGLGSLYSPVPDNYRAPTRVNKTLHREEILIRRTKTLPRKGGDWYATDDARYIETLRLIRNRTGDMFDPTHAVSVPRGPSVSLLSCVWVQDPNGRLSVDEIKSHLVDNQG